MLGNINPDGKQNEVLALPAKGHTVVLGTAGSGKTTMALLRAIGLANLPAKPKVLVVTFNRALVQYMSAICNTYPRNLIIESYHKFARGYLNSLGKMPRRNGIVENQSKEEYIAQAIARAQQIYPEESTLKRPLSVFVDEITFIEKFGIKTMEEYYNAERIGRAVANIKRVNRKWFFGIYEDYLNIRKEDGYLYDWDDLAMYVYNELLSDETDRLYTHIIVDEGQDFSPMMIKSLTKAVPNDGSFTFFGDVAQQIYGGRLSWRDSGMRISENKIWRFDKNYRNPATIIAFANDITNSQFWDNNQDMVSPSNYIAQGPKPVLVKFDDKKDEFSWLVSQVAQNMSSSSNLIVCRNRKIVDFVRRLFEKNNIPVTIIDKDKAGLASVNGVYVTTFHSAKGLEFENVFVPFLKDGVFPDRETIESATDIDSSLADELKLLYVAITRSKYGLFMSYHDELSPLFPTDSSNCEYVDGEELI